MSHIDYYFIGIGGVGMSGLAKILSERGFVVAGSDKSKNKYTEELSRLGTHVNLDQKESNITKDIKKIITSHAIDEDNEELERARCLKLTVSSRSELLGQLMSEKKGIAIAGTHGKTTTTSLVSLILKNEGLDPAIANGGDIFEIGTNAIDGNGEYFVAEACEYKRAFLDLKPYVGVITNIDADHLDYFKNIDNVKEAFREFASQIKKEGFLVACKDSQYLREVLENTDIKTFTYGVAEQSADFLIKNFQHDEEHQSFEIYKKGQSLGKFTMQIPGIHNALNATAATAVTLELGVRLKTIKETLSNFKGTERRMQVVGEKNGALVIDDYGHHPTEIKATLRALRDFYQGRKIWTVFQPHQYSRTRNLLADFSKSFSDTDEVIITKIYGSRDTKEDMESISGKDLSDLIEKNGKKSRYIEDFDEVVKFLNKNVKETDLVLTIGAGPVNKVAEGFVGK